MSACRRTLEELRVSLEEAEKMVPTGTSWRHYRDNKGEKPYTIIGHAITEATESASVLYQNKEGITFSRPLTEFTEEVRGGTQKRFIKV